MDSYTMDRGDPARLFDDRSDDVVPDEEMTAETVGPGSVCRRLVEIVERSGLPFILHEHGPSRTIADASQKLHFEVARIVKTIAFRTRCGRPVLAALRGTRRVDYPRLATLVGVNRRDLASLSPEEVRKLVGVEPGSVSPLAPLEDAAVLIDEDVLTIQPTIYCGIGRPDRTLEITPADLVSLTAARVGGFSR